MYRFLFYLSGMNMVSVYAQEIRKQVCLCSLTATSLLIIPIINIRIVKQICFYS